MTQNAKMSASHLSYVIVKFPSPSPPKMRKEAVEKADLVVGMSHQELYVVIPEFPDVC